MYLLDANILIYAHVAGFPKHFDAKLWLDNQINAGTKIGIPWATIFAFLRITTNPRVFKSPLNSKEAYKQIEAWLENQNMWIPVPENRHQEILRSLIETYNPYANAIPDIHLTALAIENGLTIATADEGFRIYSEITTINPIKATS